MNPAISFGDQVANFLEFRMRRWRYWDTLYDRVQHLSDIEAKLHTGFSKQRIDHERALATLDLLVGA